jgi:DNA-binding NtrC family response regulator
MDGTEIKKLEDVEREYIFTVMELYGWNRTHACKALGISVRTLRNRLSIYKMQGFDVPVSPAGAGAWRCSDCSSGA